MLCKRIDIHRSKVCGCVGENPIDSELFRSTKQLGHVCRQGIASNLVARCEAVAQQVCFLPCCPQSNLVSEFRFVTIKNIGALFFAVIKDGLGSPSCFQHCVSYIDDGAVQRHIPVLAGYMNVGQSKQHHLRHCVQLVWLSVCQ